MIDVPCVQLFSVVQVENVSPNHILQYDLAKNPGISSEVKKTEFCQVT